MVYRTKLWIFLKERASVFTQKFIINSKHSFSELRHDRKNPSKYQRGGKYFYLTQGEHINQNPTETYSETVDE